MAKQAQPVVESGIDLKCRHCGHDKFTVRQAQLNTKFATFLSWDWVNPAGTCYICESCGCIEWFYKG